MEDTVIVDVALKNELGLHARAAAAFVKTASDFECDIKILKDDREANGKSIMSLLMLAIQNGESFKISACGNDCMNAVDSLIKLIDDRFGEPA